MPPDRKASASLRKTWLARVILEHARRGMLTPSELRFGLHLVDVVGTSPDYFVGPARAAALTGLDERTVRRARAKLAALGILARVTSGGGRARAARFRFVCADEFEGWWHELEDATAAGDTEQIAALQRSNPGEAPPGYGAPRNPGEALPGYSEKPGRGEAETRARSSGNPGEIDAKAGRSSAPRTPEPIELLNRAGADASAEPNGAAPEPSEAGSARAGKGARPAREPGESEFAWRRRLASWETDMRLGPNLPEHPSRSGIRPARNGGAA